MRSRSRHLLTGAAALDLGVAVRATRRALTTAPAPGRRKRADTFALELGSRLVQRRSPLDGFHLYLVGFHPMKEAPHVQVEAHHFCSVVNEDFIQCILFDGSGPDARLVGIEYVISGRLYGDLPEDERKLWHPHNYEILSGQLVAPGLPAAIEKQLMRRMLDGYGKTWHAWPASDLGEPPGLPLGAPCLAWSFNHDGEVDAHLVSARDARCGVDTGERRADRASLAAYAHPQEGEDVLAGQFERPSVERASLEGETAEAPAPQ
jgi:hypothetical protein